MELLEHLDKENLHHAYLVEGVRDEIVPLIIQFCKEINIKTSGNPDFINISIDNFKIEDAFELRSMSTNKSFSGGKRIFTICANTLSLDSQNVLLKMFEEPVENTHFFLIVPDTNALLKTVVSRFYLIKPKNESENYQKMAEKFIMMPFKSRIDFIKELLVEPEDEDTNVPVDSARSRALGLLNAIESVLNDRLTKNAEQVQFLNHIFKVREYLRMPGSSAKNLMESVALVVPQY